MRRLLVGNRRSAKKVGNLKRKKAVASEQPEAQKRNKNESNYYKPRTCRSYRHRFILSVKRQFKPIFI